MKQHKRNFFIKFLIEEVSSVSSQKSESDVSTNNPKTQNSPEFRRKSNHRIYYPCKLIQCLFRISPSSCEILLIRSLLRFEVNSYLILNCEMNNTSVSTRAETFRTRKHVETEVAVNVTELIHAHGNSEILLFSNVIEKGNSAKAETVKK